jgi:hypothetical protein
VAEQNAHELNGDGSVIMDSEKVGSVFYGRSIGQAGSITEGLISGPDPLLRGIKTASRAQLALEDGPILNIVAREVARYSLDKGGQTFLPAR